MDQKYRHAAEKLFNELLANYRAKILPDVVSVLAEATKTERGQLTQISNCFFCVLHFLVGLADCVGATLKLWEATYLQLTCTSQWNAIKTWRLHVKSFMSEDHSKRGIPFNSELTCIYLRNKDIDMILLAAFNILFYDAAGIYFFKKPICLVIWPQLIGLSTSFCKPSLLTFKFHNTLLDVKHWESSTGWWGAPYGDICDCQQHLF